MKFDLFLLSAEEKKIVKQSIKKLPQMKKSNPLSQMIGARVGDIIKIIDDSSYSRMRSPSTYTSFVIITKWNG